jgi:hypothetical protein
MTGTKILFAAIRLSEIGVVLVGILFAAAALGKWKKRLAFRFMAWSSAAGAAIPFVICPIWMFVNTHFDLRAKVVFEDLALALWRSSILLMGLEGPGPIVLKLLFVAALVLMNMGLYGLVGICVGFAWQRFRSQTGSISGEI